MTTFTHWQPWILDEEHALPILKAAWDRGINTIDTANMYSNGASERIIGTFLKKVCLLCHDATATR
jgi:aryl-alcohol dehydrogenase-like predicted oxidoreductase